jgi:hypothetical protein
MADHLSLVEANENRFMRAWISGDAKALKTLTSSNFRLVVGSKPSVLLDTKSWLEAAKGRFRCSGYRFGDIYSRRLGASIIFGTQMDMQAELDGQPWSGEVWLTDIWQKARLRSRWQLAERHLSRPEQSKDVPALLRSFQLWK